MLYFTNSCIRLYLAYILYPQEGTYAPFPPLFYLVDSSCALSSHVQLISGALLCIHVPVLPVCPVMYKGLGRGEGFAWDWGPTARLPE